MKENLLISNSLKLLLIMTGNISKNLPRLELVWMLVNSDLNSHSQDVSNSATATAPAIDSIKSGFECVAWLVSI